MQQTVSVQNVLKLEPDECFLNREDNRIIAVFFFYKTEIFCLNMICLLFCGNRWVVLFLCHNKEYTLAIYPCM